METGITTTLPPAAPAEPHPQFIYTLDRWDYVAWWMCEWDRAHPASTGSRLETWMIWAPLLVLVPVAMFFLVGWCTLLHDKNLSMLSLFTAFALFGLWLLAGRRIQYSSVW